ncbi:probable inactive serine/threonine-protein kinase fnkC [Abrus precatorius]|uniref:Probable inactive serine/threonine-protein kinase fnkC n=1 Tax=Abrus precatorius TaxID=3816 RepID=A0A8B8KZQ2_ABRPR|nr:probable inactive serine/threonine-protein kinase fnkC [Abrus precatorius]
MEIKTANPLFSVTPMKGRKAPPSQYTFKIISFSWLSKASVQKFSSEEFEAGGHKWSLSIYPNGNSKGGGEGHVSIYLVLMDPSLLPVDWEVNAIVNFSAYNFMNDEYVTTQDADVRRFHVLKTEWGIPNFIDIDTFNDPSNGYLMNDTCVFGAEVFVVKTTNKGDCLSMIHGPATFSYTWKFNNFSIAKLDKYESEPFAGGNYKWKLLLYPDGVVEGKGNSISLFLVLEVSTLPPNTKLIADCIVRAKDQISGQHAQQKFCRKFSNSKSTWGSRQLVALAKLKDPDKGFLVDDTCILEAEFTVLGLVTPRID